MDSSKETDRKSIARETYIRKRESLTPKERREKSEKICRRILAGTILQKAYTVMLYKYIRGEVQLTTLEESLKETSRKRLVYPVCADAGKMLAVLPGNPDVTSDAWRKGPFGIMEPVPEKGQIVPAEEIDLVVCPAVAFDGSGTRLGMGGGYYDRFLPLCKNASVIAAAFEVQRAPALPVSGTDYPVRSVITEKADDGYTNCDQCARRCPVARLQCRNGMRRYEELTGEPYAVPPSVEKKESRYRQIIMERRKRKEKNSQ